MATVTVSSTSAASPTQVYAGFCRKVRLINRDASIVVHVRDPSVATAGTWADLYPGDEHVYERANMPANIVAYADSGTPQISVNEIMA